MRFQLFRDGTELSDPALITMNAKQVICASGAPTDEVEFLSSGNTSLRYDPTAHQSIYNGSRPRHRAPAMR